MKKYLSLITVFILTIILTGCVKYNSTVEVKSNKSVNLNIIYAIDTDILSNEELGDMSITDDDKKEYIQNGFTVDNYKDGSYEGVKLTKKFKNIDNISSESDVTYNLESDISGEKSSNTNMFKVKKGFFKNTYVLKMDGSNDMTDSDTSEFGSSMELKFTLKLPHKAKSNNATTVNGKELVWDLTKVSNVEAEFTLYNAPFYILIGGIVVVVIIVLCIIIKGKKKNGNSPIANMTDNMSNNINTNNSIITPMNNEFNQSVNNSSISNNVANGINTGSISNTTNVVNPEPIYNGFNNQPASTDNNVNNVINNGFNNNNYQQPVNNTSNASVENNINNGMGAQFTDNFNGNINQQPVNSNVVVNNENQDNNNFNNPNNGVF